MPRPRAATDAEILAATSRLLAKVGPYRMTLADVGREVGITASAISQRFGTKRDLLLALVAASTADLARIFDDARTRAPTRVGAITDALVECARPLATPQQVAASLAMLQMDILDPAFGAHARAFLDAQRGHVRALAKEAIARGEMEPLDTDALAHAIEIAYDGTLLRAAVRNEDPREAVRRDVATTLRAWSALARVRDLGA